MKRATNKLSIRWPKTGDDPFLIPGSEWNRATLANLSWLTQFRADDSMLAEGFKEAADMIVQKLRRGKHAKNPDIYFFPVAYLYRHSIELQMKDLLRLALKLKLIEPSEPLERALGGHRLASLWHHTRLALLKHRPDDPHGTLKGVGGVIQKFHNADRTGQAFRYIRDNNGGSHLPGLPGAVSLTQLAKTCDAISNFFSGCSDEFAYLLEIDAEMRDYYSP